MTKIILERGIAFFEDGSEVSDVSIPLIKSAPKLLNALKVILLTEHIRDYLVEYDQKALEQVRAAIDEGELCV
jgi:hypothetical protein